MDTLETRATTSAAPSADSPDSVGEAEAACCAPAPEISLDHTQRLAALAERLKAIADPTRLRMLELLAQQPAALCVCEITDEFTLHQPTISHHLKVLHEAGLLDRDKRGVWVYYRASTRALAGLAALIGSTAAA